MQQWEYTIVSPRILVNYGISYSWLEIAFQSSLLWKMSVECGIKHDQFPQELWKVSPDCRRVARRVGRGLSSPLRLQTSFSWICGAWFSWRRNAGTLGSGTWSSSMWSPPACRAVGQCHKRTGCAAPCQLYPGKLVLSSTKRKTSENRFYLLKCVFWIHKVH